MAFQFAPVPLYDAVVDKTLKMTGNWVRWLSALIDLIDTMPRVLA